MKMTYNSDAN